jgi:hypothetical protein
MHRLFNKMLEGATNLAEGTCVRFASNERIPDVSLKIDLRNPTGDLPTTAQS